MEFAFLKKLDEVHWVHLIQHLPIDDSGVSHLKAVAHCISQGDSQVAPVQQGPSQEMTLVMQLMERWDLMGYWKTSLST